MPAERREYSRTELSMVVVIQRFPGRPLHRMPWCFRPVRTDGARGRVLHAGRVEGRAPAALVVLRQLQIEALAVHPYGHAADAGPGVEPVRRAQSARSYEGIAQPAKPIAAMRSRPRWSSTRYSKTLSAWSKSVCGMVSPNVLAVLRLITNSNLVGCSTGRSAGLAPFRILSTNTATCCSVSSVYSW